MGLESMGVRIVMVFDSYRSGGEHIPQRSTFFVECFGHLDRVHTRLTKSCGGCERVVIDAQRRKSAEGSESNKQQWSSKNCQPSVLVERPRETDVDRVLCCRFL